MNTYLAIYEQAGDGTWSARAADLPVYAAGATREEAESDLQDAIRLYLEDASEPVRSTVLVGTVEV